MITKQRLTLLAACLTLAACAPALPEIPVNPGAIEPGTQVTRAGNPLPLLGTPLRLGDPLPAVTLIDNHMRRVDLGGLRGEWLLISIVPSLDTQVCERQTHLLGEEGAELPPEIRRITISRDLPFAQKRFEDETGFHDVLFLSDYQTAAFGRATGLLVDEIYLLARGVLVVDREGLIRYMQFVPELGHLPDMEKAFAEARRLLDGM